MNHYSYFVKVNSTIGHNDLIFSGFLERRGEFHSETIYIVCYAYRSPEITFLNEGLFLA